MSMVTGIVKCNTAVKSETVKTVVGSIPVYVFKNRALYRSAAAYSLDGLV